MPWIRSIKTSISALMNSIPNKEDEPVSWNRFVPEGGFGGFPVLDVAEQEVDILISREQIFLRDDQLCRLPIPGSSHISDMVQRFLEVLG